MADLFFSYVEVASKALFSFSFLLGNGMGDSDLVIIRLLLLVILFILGTLVGALVNSFVDQYGWLEKYRSPWRALPDEIAPLLPRRLLDYVPVIGWISLRRWSNVLFPSSALLAPSRQRTNSPEFIAHYQQQALARQLAKHSIPGLTSRWFWLRPLLVELGSGLFFVWLYWWIVLLGQWSLPPLVFIWGAQDVIVNMPILTGSDLFFVYIGGVFLYTLLLAASLIDLDDYVIPDILTIFGTIAGLGLLTCFPKLVGVPWIGFTPTIEGYWLPIADPVLYCQTIFPANKLFALLPLVIMLGCWSLWCFAVLDRRWYVRWGLKRAIVLFFRGLRRSPLTSTILILWPLGLMAICWVFFATPGEIALSPPVALDSSSSFGSMQSWICEISSRTALFNAMVGMTVGMVLIWSVRIVGHWALGLEAMGFGDVMLMATIGAFIGWQGAVITFFLAPFAGLVFAVVRIAMGMQKEIPYGPFLCLGTFVYLIGRRFFWDTFEPLLKDPLLVFLLFVVGMTLLGLMLRGWRMIRQRLFE